MGKSTTAAIMKQYRLPVHDADKAVHRLLSHDKTTRAKIKDRFPSCIVKGQIDRKKLGQIVFNDEDAKQDLEAILHPRVRADSEKFLKSQRRMGRKIAVLDIPLLFETGQSGRFDFIICATAPKTVQMKRVLRRQNMTAARFNAIRRSQMSDSQKRQLSDFVINTARGHGHVSRLIRCLVRS